MRAIRPLLLSVAAGLLLASPLAAQKFEDVPEAKQPAPPAVPTTGVRVGIINIQLAMFRTQEGQKAAEELQARFNPQQAELQKLQEEIRDLENKLRTQERTLSDEARVQLMREIEQKRKEGARKQEDLQDAVQNAQSDYVRKISEKMQRIIDRYAREKNLSLVLNVFQGGPVIYATPAVNITDDIVALYDQTYPVEAATNQTQPPSSGDRN